MRRFRFLPSLVAILIAFTVASCSGDHQAPIEPSTDARADLLGSLTETLTEEPNDDIASLVTSTTTNLDLQSTLRGLTSGVLACPSSKTYSASAVIGPEGGKIKVGPHELVIPKNALATATSITATAPAGDVTTVKFEPHGLRFERPTWLTMSYAHCPTITKVSKRIVYVDGSLTILEVLPSVNDLLNERVTGRLEHFSTYAVAE